MSRTNRSPEFTLDLNTENVNYVSVINDLSPAGAGVAVLPKVLEEYQLEYMLEEIYDPFAVQWRDNHKPFENKRGTVIQNHDVFALKLSQGDQRWVYRVPKMRQLAANIGGLVRNFSDAFPSLRNWQEDEMSLHRYDDQEVGLSKHRDNLCFIGMIAILTIEGASDVMISNEDGSTELLPVEAGDLTLMRAPGLYEPHPGKEIRPDHAVVNLKTPTRTSFIVRANSEPGKIVKGFTYENWAGEKDAA